MIELLLEAFFSVVLEFILYGLLWAPGRFLLVLFKQREVDGEPDFTAVCLSLLFWGTVGLTIWLIATVF